MMNEFSFTINDPSLVQWLQDIQSNNSKENFDKKMEHILKTYYDLTQNMQWNISDNGIDQRLQNMEEKLKNKLDWVEQNFSQKVQLFENTLQQSVSVPIQSEFSKLKDSIDIFRGNVQNASKKGKMGENLIEKIVESYFPGAEISNTTKQAHQSDYHLTLDNHNLLIEVKTYQKNVPTKEVEKFFSDLQNHPTAQCGILISLSSGISKRPKISYEWITDDKGVSKLITFIPNSGTDGHGIIWGILFELMVLGYLENLNKSVSTCEVDMDKVTDMIKNQMQWVDHIINDMNISIQEVQNSHQNIIKQVEKTNHLLVSKWNENTKNLKKLIESYRKFIENGEFTFLPIITNSLTANSGELICKTCSKKYKLESAYKKHVNKCNKDISS